MPQPKTFPLLALALLTLLSPAVRARPHGAVFAPRPAPIVKQPSAEDEAHLLGDPFTVVRTVRALPGPVRAVLAPLTKDPRDGMADPGKRFQISDLLGPEHLPYRRLVLAASNADYCLVYYELGGIAYRREVVLYRLQGGRAIKRWRAELQSAYTPAKLAQLRKVIKSGKYETPYGA